MGIEKIFKLDISGFANFFAGNKNSVVSGNNNTTPVELQCLLNNVENNSHPYIDKAEKQQSHKRIEETSMQTAIQRFNNLSDEEKLKILDNADASLHAKLNTFIERSSDYGKISTRTSDLFNQLSRSMYYIIQNDAYDDTSMDNLWAEFEQVMKKCNDSIEYISETFLQHRGREILRDKSISMQDTANYAVSKSANLKQTVNSYAKIIKSKLRELNRTPIDKSDIMREIITTIARIQTMTEIFQSDSVGIMNAYISEAVTDENEFSKEVPQYAQKGIPKDLSLKNKVIENAVLDAIIEGVNNKISNPA